ncbi:MAG: DNA-directed RNA polymerase subunit alpha C-terminal domain-containing protein [Candidatus Moraniibacteriota bacterium]
MTEQTLIAIINGPLADEELATAFRNTARFNKHKWRVPVSPESITINSPRFYSIEFDGRTRNSCHQPKSSRQSRYLASKLLRKNGSTYRLTIELYLCPPTLSEELPDYRVKVEMRFEARIQCTSGINNKNSMYSYFDDFVFSYIKYAESLRKEREPILEEKSGLGIDALRLSTRAGRCLYSSEIFTVGDLICMTDTELLKINNFGTRTLAEVKSRLSEIGLSLKETLLPSEE